MSPDVIIYLTSVGISWLYIVGIWASAKIAELCGIHRRDELYVCILLSFIPVFQWLLLLFLTGTLLVNLVLCIKPKHLR